ncbi:mitochondrial inner membrane protease ATP23 homolog isoform X1 [Gallus gallus]|uniref:mitochondrial inner membrane protease ATP23 homolog isoform X1 n=1 Tax=Gallus gallus TaxID=9031 RepID=UPI000739ED59|nr:mitochondrial inner membrane protease ATP23 homolog isoform X1 [Gallus gallus]XP_046763188.1 mitochondrial inner membrane protease ATP23 homolog isoform X1 [Gallus gallus]|eukprot:XP_015136890.1 mitochondrial inner membrane protease ATP23 homolog isoform X1 [Gallus gallus]
MEDGKTASPPGAEGGEEEDDFGYRLFPDRNKEPQSFLVRSLFTFHNRWLSKLLSSEIDCSNVFLDPYAQLLIAAMKQSGCTVFNDRHFSCENCDGCVSGGFDSATSQIVLCQNNIRHQSHMNRVVAHELIHAFDHCRAHVDWFKNVKHLACSEIRAANLSGDCTLMNEIARFKFGLKGHHQTCVRDRAIRSILAVRKVSRETAEKAVDEVFDACFNDLEPFGRIPHSKTDAKRAYKDFLNRDRYTANL